MEAFFVHERVNLSCPAHQTTVWKPAKRSKAEKEQGRSRKKPRPNKKKKEIGQDNSIYLRGVTIHCSDAMTLEDDLVFHFR